MADLREGTVLGKRFEVVGVLGRGGTATVYLARDRLRGQRVALKVLHPHLAHDPSMRGRLRREVEAAAVLRHEAALVAYDLHDLDGMLALSLPLHRGQTLSEQVATRGRLSVDEARSLGIRVAGALADAHRQGLLHRDVTPNNVLLDQAADAVLTDFGLARLAETGATRSTGVLGTAGYAAPEIYGGIRHDPRSDLYGLGGVLYLALTGQPPFDAPTPMGSLQRQLADALTPVRELRPETPPALAELVERLLRHDTDRRPQGAREVLDALELGVVPPDDAVRTGPRPRRHLAPGPYCVVVSERHEDFGRRADLRSTRYRRVPTAERHIRRWARQLVDGLKETFGIEEEPDPEEELVAEVARAAALPVEALQQAPELLAERFRLVDGVDHATAQRLSRRARELGFDARISESRPPPLPLWVRTLPLWVGAGWVAVVLAMLLGLPSVELLILSWLTVTVVAGAQAGTWRPFQRAEHLPVAYIADLSGHLSDRFSHLALPAEEAEVPAQLPSPPSHGTRLAERAHACLDALEQAVAEQEPDLPALALRDLRETIGSLRETTNALAVDVDRLEAALGEGEPSDAGWIHARLARLQTLARAGERVDPAEVRRLEAALEAHRADQAAADTLESQLTACQAQLLEIASATSRVRRELLGERSLAHTADRLVHRLRTETHAAHAARREAEQRMAALRTEG